MVFFTHHEIFSEQLKSIEIIIPVKAVIRHIQISAGFQAGGCVIVE
jgi:hypothetical protein